MIQRNSLVARSSMISKITNLELRKDALWWWTFYYSDCRVNRDEFNDSKISEKYEGLTQQMSSKILTVLTIQSFSCHHLSRWLLFWINQIQCFKNNWKIWRFDLVNEVENITAQTASILSSLSIFSRSNQSMRVDYLTYFERRICSFESIKFNASKIIEKYKDLI